jgi:L-aspartate oxidase
MDIVARSILNEMKKSGSDRVYLDVTHLPPHLITTRFPHIYRFCLDRGLDITRNQIPVAPAAHYMIGGIRTNSWGETNIAGLLATGRPPARGSTAPTAWHPTPPEAIVFSKRIIERTKSKSRDKIVPAVNAKDVHSELSERPVLKGVPVPGLAALQQLHLDKAGIIRDNNGLTQAAGLLASWQSCLPPPTDQPSYELSNLVLTGRLLVEAALIREESRGAHFRSDFPRTSPDWQCHIVWKK